LFKVKINKGIIEGDIKMGLQVTGGLIATGGMIWGSGQAPTPPPPSTGWNDIGVLNTTISPWSGRATTIESTNVEGELTFWIGSSGGSLAKSSSLFAGQEGYSWTLVAENLSYYDGETTYTSNTIADMTQISLYGNDVLLIIGSANTSAAYAYDLDLSGGDSITSFTSLTSPEPWQDNKKVAYDSASGITLLTDGTILAVRDGAWATYTGPIWGEGFGGATTIPTFETLVTGNGYFLATGNNEVFKSINFEGEVSPVEWLGSGDIGVTLIPAWTSNIWVAGSTTSNAIYTSTDGLTWASNISVEFDGFCRELIYDGTKLVYLGAAAVGELPVTAYVVTSTDDGGSWTELVGANTSIAGYVPRAIGSLTNVVLAGGVSTANIALYIS
jgi:hypothetical protein